MSTVSPGDRIPVIADVDTGIDDALALLLLARHPGIDLRAVTAVAGNVDVDTALRNTLDVLALADATQVPVGRGAERPLINAPHDARAVHGGNGLGDVRLPRSGAGVSPLAGPELIKTAVEQSPRPPTLLGLGPLTNVALFLRSYPEHAARLGRIVFMGGTAGVGNATAVTEFNAWHDPEALAIVISSGVPVVMYGLDVFYHPTIDELTTTALEGSDDPVLHFVGQVLRFTLGRKDRDPSLGATIGDAGAATFLTDPDAVGVVDYPVQVVLSGPFRGQTVVDRRGFAGESELHGLAETSSVVGVAMSCDADRLVRAYLAGILPGSGVSPGSAELR